MSDEPAAIADYFDEWADSVDPLWQGGFCSDNEALRERSENARTAARMLRQLDMLPCVHRQGGCGHRQEQGGHAVVTADDTGTDPEPTGAERYLADRLRDPKYRAAYAAFRSQFPLPDTADDTGTDWAALADVLEDWPYGQPRVTKQEAELAAVGLRRLAQLDTAIGPPMRLMDLMARGTTMDAEGDELAERLSLIYAAAVVGSGEQPEGPTTPEGELCD